MSAELSFGTIPVIEAGMMTVVEARTTANKIKAQLSSARELIYDLHERKGWKALGYKNWGECLEQEFGQSRSHLYRQLDAAQIERDIQPALEMSPMGDKSSVTEVIESAPKMSPMGDKPQIPERQLRPLTTVPRAERAEVYREAIVATNGKPTAKAVQEAVDRRTRVNGVLTDDPPHVAKMRAAGKIPANVVVEVDEPEIVVDQSETTVDESKIVVDVDELLASLTIREKLVGACLRDFDNDVRNFVELTESRRAFAYKATRILNQRGRRNGAYGWKTSFYLKTAHPKEWLLCPATEYGGCGGAGQVMLVGKCPKCHGLGYRIP